MSLICSWMILAGTASLWLHSARADDFCENWAAYIWDFDRQNDISADSTWSELTAMNDRLQKGRRIAAVGSLSRVEAVPFPGLPSVIENELDPQTQAKLRGLYDKYVLLGRRIEDRWKDRFRSTESPTSMHRFAAEREDMIVQMNRIARSAKTELLHYGLRQRDCFTDYETYVQKQFRALNEALASATSGLKLNDSVWAHAYEPKEDAAQPAAEDHPVKHGRKSKRKPSSSDAKAKSDFPAIVPDAPQVSGPEGD